MELSLLTFVLVLGAGLTSVLSPCVLPILPIIVTGTERESRWRPFFMVHRGLPGKAALIFRKK